MTSFLKFWKGFVILMTESELERVMLTVRSKFKDLVFSLASQGLSSGAKSRLCSACVLRIILYGSETWQVKVEDVIRLERNDAQMVRWMYNVSFDDKTSTEGGT